MKKRLIMNQRGVTLIELLVAFILFALVSAASYRLFVAQTQAYTVQDQVVEIQQSLRAAMELILRDARMAGFDNDSPASQVAISSSLVPGNDSIGVNYEYDDTTRYTVMYWRDAVTSRLFRQLTTTKSDGTVVVGPQCTLLEYVDNFSLIYGIDNDGSGNEDGVVDTWETDSSKIGTQKVIAVRLRLVGGPEPVTSEVQKMVSPRSLESTVALRNQCYKH